MEGAAAASSLSSVIGDITTVMGGLTDWAGEVLQFMTSNPLLLIGAIGGVAFLGVKLVKRLLP